MMIVIKNNNNNYNSNNNCNNNSNNNNRREWKIQLTMLNSCISTKRVEDKRTIYTKTEPVEIFMVSNTEDVINKLFNTFTNVHKKHQMKEEANLFLIVLNY